MGDKEVAMRNFLWESHSNFIFNMIFFALLVHDQVLYLVLIQEIKHL